MEWWVVDSQHHSIFFTINQRLSCNQRWDFFLLPVGSPSLGVHFLIPSISDEAMQRMQRVKRFMITS